MPNSATSVAGNQDTHEEATHKATTPTNTPSTTASRPRSGPSAISSSLAKEVAAGVCVNSGGSRRYVRYGTARLDTSPGYQPRHEPAGPRDGDPGILGGESSQQHVGRAAVEEHRRSNDAALIETGHEKRTQTPCSRARGRVVQSADGARNRKDDAGRARRDRGQSGREREIRQVKRVTQPECGMADRPYEPECDPPCQAAVAQGARHEHGSQNQPDRRGRVAAQRTLYRDTANDDHRRQTEQHDLGARQRL